MSAIEHLGGYTSLPLPTRIASAVDIPAHLVLTIEGILHLYGAYFVGMSPWVAIAFAVVHLVGLARALWGVCRAFRRFFSADLIVPVLATGIVINMAAYVFSIKPATWFDTREIAAMLPFGAVLADRLLAEPLARMRVEPVLAGVLACYAVALGYGASQPSKTDGEHPIVGAASLGHPQPGHPRAGRASGAHLPLRDLHRHGLEPQPPRRPGQPPVIRARQPPLTRWSALFACCRTGTFRTLAE